MSTTPCSRFKNLSVADMSSPVQESPTPKPNIKLKIRCKYIVKLKISPVRLADLLQSLARESATRKVSPGKQMWTCPCCNVINEYDPSQPQHKGPPKRTKEKQPEAERDEEARPVMNTVPRKRPRGTQHDEQQDTNNGPVKEAKQTSQQQPPKRPPTFSEWMEANHPEDEGQQSRHIEKQKQKSNMFDLLNSCSTAELQPVRKPCNNLLNLPEKILNQIFDYVMRQPDQPATFYTKEETHVHPELLPVLLVNHRFRAIALESTYRVNTFILDSLSGLQTEWFTKEFFMEMTYMEFRLYYIDGKFLHEDSVMRFFDTLRENWSEVNIEFFPKRWTIVFNSAVGVDIPKSDWVVKIVKTFTLVFAHLARRPGVQFTHYLDDPSYSWVYPTIDESDSMLEEHKIKGNGRPRPCKVRQVIENEDESAHNNRINNWMDFDETEE